MLKYFHNQVLSWLQYFPYMCIENNKYEVWKYNVIKILTVLFYLCEKVTFHAYFPCFIYFTCLFLILIVLCSSESYVIKAKTDDWIYFIFNLFIYCTILICTLAIIYLFLLIYFVKLFIFVCICLCNWN